MGQPPMQHEQVLRGGGVYIILIILCHLCLPCICIVGQGALCTYAVYTRATGQFGTGLLHGVNVALLVCKKGIDVCW